MKTASLSGQKPQKQPRSPWTRSLLFFYDAVICLLSCFPICYESGRLSFSDTLPLRLLIYIAFIFASRLLFKVYRQIWRYGSIQSYLRLILADSMAYLCFFAADRLCTPDNIPFLRLFSGFCMCLLGTLVIRMLYLYAYRCCRLDTPKGQFFTHILQLVSLHRIDLTNSPQQHKIAVAIVGAGSVGVALCRELLDNDSAYCIPLCFVDTDPDKIGRQINGRPVISENRVEILQQVFHIQEVIIALPQLDAERKNELYSYYKRHGFLVKTYDYPTMQQGPGGHRQLRDFNIEDLLFRSTLTVQDDHTCAYYRNKVVMITGGGGSIGSELCRQIAKMGPRQILIVDICENGAYDVQQDLKIAYNGSLDLQVEILSVTDRAALEKVFARYRPQVVLHAAAHKHVPLMENNCCEAIYNNVFGTLNTVQLADQYGVEHFMMVSTDKAVNPTNVMGATKRMCEMIVQSYSTTSSTSFSATRFGNVLGSAGSVIPLFRRQIAAGGPVTITDKRIIRYFMTIPEAAQLVLRAGAMAKSGELFVLDMGKPVKILDLAENMIRLSGFTPYRDIDIKEVGLRPGEKLYEELLVKSESLDKTASDLIFVERDIPPERSVLENALKSLQDALARQDDALAREALRRAVPTYHTPEEVNARAIYAAEMQQAETRSV